ncbi:MAG: M24 family metallopeptidase [Spirochaetaceae bacterium]
MNTRKTNQKIKDLCTSMKSDALLVSNPLSLAFLTGIELPFAEHFPEKPVTALFFRNGPALLLCPHEWRKAIQEQGWNGELTSYRDNSAHADSFTAKEIVNFAVAQNADSCDIGYEGEYISQAFFELLQKFFSQTDFKKAVHFKSADDAFNSRKMIKTREQIERLRTAAEQLEFGIIGALQHVEGSLEDTGYTAAEFCERIRVHVYECGGTAGGLSATASGDNATQLYGLPRGKFQPGELVRIEASSRYFGATACSSRMMSIGEATELQRRAYRENLFLKKELCSLLSPGKICSEIFFEIEQLALREGIDLLPHYGIGHGIGTSEKEAPLLHPHDKTVLKEGMTIVAAVYTEGPRKELICSKDIYLVGSDGPECISSFHNWEELYEVTGFRSAH